MPSLNRRIAASLAMVVVVLLLLESCAAPDSPLCAREAACAAQAEAHFPEIACRQNDQKDRAAAADKGCSALYQEVSACLEALPCATLRAPDLAGAACPRDDLLACLN